MRVTQPVGRHFRFHLQLGALGGAAHDANDGRRVEVAAAAGEED
jgi:hypothetical protein